MFNLQASGCAGRAGAMRWSNWARGCPRIPSALKDGRWLHRSECAHVVSITRINRCKCRSATNPYRLSRPEPSLDAYLSLLSALPTNHDLFHSLFHCVSGPSGSDQCIPGRGIDLSDLLPLPCQKRGLQADSGLKGVGPCGEYQICR